jgi:glycosyltransferase involved in cell wall biosynthesis
VPTFSVITVTLNCAATLTRTLDSVRAQTCRDFEWLVIDGASTDGTLRLLEAAADSNGTWVSEADQGLYDAMNKGIARARGDYVLFLNAGDHFTSAHSLAALKVAAATDRQPLYYGRILWIDPDRERVSCSEHGHIRYKSQLHGQNFPHPATLYRRDVFERYGLFDLRHPILADYEWNLRALVAHDECFRLLDTVVTTFYTGGRSTQAAAAAAREREKALLRAAYFKGQPLSERVPGHPRLGSMLRLLSGARLNRVP